MAERHLVDLLLDPTAPWAFSPDLEVGSLLLGRQEFPDIEVVRNEVVEVKKLSVQLLRVKDPQTGDDCLMRRLVGELEDGKIIDVGEKFVVPSVMVDGEVDVSKCAACLEPIHPDDLEIYEGKAYHDRCMEE